MQLLNVEKTAALTMKSVWTLIWDLCVNVRLDIEKMKTTIAVSIRCYIYVVENISMYNTYNIIL